MPDTTRETRVADVLRARPLTSFFALSYAVTWLRWAPIGDRRGAGVLRGNPHTVRVRAAGPT